MTPRDYEEPVSFWEWVRTMLLSMIPLVGFILIVYWACTSGGKASRRNLFRAYLFLMFVGTLAVVGLIVAVPGFLPAYARAVAESTEALAGANKTEHPPEASGATSDAAASTPSTSATSASASANVPATAAPPAASSASAPAASKPPTRTPDEPTRSLRSSDGRVIEARVISLTDDDVTIVRVNGQEFTIPMSRFAPEEVAYFMRLRHGRDAFE